MAWDRLMEEHVMPMAPAPLPRPCHVLVLAPHPDDEVFGCGGTLALWAQSKVPATVHILTDGSAQMPLGESCSGRRAESEAAADIIGYGTPRFWGLPDRGLRYGEGLVRRVLKVIEECGADWVLAPALSELHPDHQVLGLATAEAVRRLQGDRILAFYEVSAPLQPNLLIDISSTEEIKHRAMRCFVSQESVEPYGERIRGLNRYRAYSLGARCRAAEAFFHTHARDLLHGLWALPRSWLDGRAACRAAVDSADIPMISVIVRSMDRPSLREALQSLADQTYPNIQVVLVNAKGGRHSPASVRQPHWDWVFVDGTEPLGRSRAANVGLQNAQGRWILFLDDDDVLLPDHLDKLAQALRDNPSHLAAYTGVRVVDEKSAPLWAYERPFCLERLLAANFIPNMAILFDRVLVDERCCRFDESLDVLEDWDFLLQLARYTDFLYVPGISAIYRYGIGQSGLSRGRREEFYRRHRARVMEKWFHRLGLEALDGALDALSQETDHLRGELERLRRELDETRREKAQAEARYEEALTQERQQRIEREAAVERLEALSRNAFNELEEARIRLSVLEARLQEAEARLHGMESSRIWKATYPVRYCAHKLKKALGLV